MSDDYEVGYKKPPKNTRFRKGHSGNPAGRPKKQPAHPDENSLKAILERTANRTVEIAGEKRSYLELEILSLQKKASMGDVPASRHLSKLRSEAGLTVLPKPGGGVLVVPGMLDEAEWERRASANQAKFRGQDPEGLARLYPPNGVGDEESDERS